MNIFSLMLPIMLIILSGYLSTKYDVFSHESSKSFIQFTFYIAIPCQLFLYFSTTPINEFLNIRYIVAFALCIAITGTMIFFYSKNFLKRSLSESALNVMGTSQVNGAYFGIPFFILVFNNPAPLIPIIIFQVIVLTTIVLFMIEYDIQKRNPRRTCHYLDLIGRTLIVIVKLPIIIAAFLGIIFSFYEIHLPNVLNKYLSLMGVAAAPLALFSVGQSLFFDIKKIHLRDLIEVSVLIATKLILLPLLAFIIGKYVFKLDPFWLASLVIIAAMPSPKNMFIFSMQYDLDIKRASTVVSLTTLLSLITLNILLGFLKV